MAKRKAPADAHPDAEPPRRSTRARTSTTSRAAPSPAATPASSRPQSSSKSKSSSKPKSPSKPKSSPKPKSASSKSSKKTADTPAVEKEPAKSEAAPDPRKNGAAAAKPKAAAQTKAGGGVTAERRQYWLMKAEPETRLENGVDVSFSIDDLAAKKEPEPWDGIRNYAARNNLRAMKKGDLAFFWHSNCKEPGLAGTMEIVQEHSPDFSASDPKSAYYDPNPTTASGEAKWSVVHVEFRRKFLPPVTLKELRAHADGPLAEMQMLKQTRLSVSRVSEEEWEFLIGLAEEKGEK